MPFRHLLSNSSTLVLIGACLLVGAGCKRASATAEHTAPAAASVKVASSAVQSVTIPKKLRLTGELRGNRETDLAANIAGRVTKTSVERGQTVKRGDVLAQVDVRAAALALAEARIQVETSLTQQAISQVDCERYRQLIAAGVVSAHEYDQIMAKCKTAPHNVDAARARQNIAAKNVGDGIIRAPFDGVVTERAIEVGEYVQASSRVVSLAQVDELRLVFSLPEKHFPDVKVGAEVEFRVAAYPTTAFKASVSRVSGAVRDTRDVVIEASLKNADQKLLPGMFVDLELNVGDEVLPAVPEAAVFEENGKHNVFVVQNGTLEQRVLEPAPAFKGQVPVRRGLRLGEQVVSAGVKKLENGQRVN